MGKERIYDKKKIKRSLGITLALFFVMIILSPASPFWGLGWLTVFLGGIVGFYCFGALAIFIGILLAIKGDLKKTAVGPRFFFGMIIFLFGLGMIWSQSYYSFGSSSSNIGDFVAFMNDYSHSENGYSPIMLFSSANSGGGIIATSLAYGISQATPALTFFISILLLIGGMALAFWPGWKKLFAFISAKIRIGKANKEAKKANMRAEESIKEQNDAYGQNQSGVQALAYGNNQEQINDDSMFMLTYGDEETTIEPENEKRSKSQEFPTQTDMQEVAKEDFSFSDSDFDNMHDMSNAGLHEVRFSGFDSFGEVQEKNETTSEPESELITDEPQIEEKQPIEEQNSFVEPLRQEIFIEEEKAIEVIEDEKPSEEEQIIMPLHESRNEGGIDSFLDEEPIMPLMNDSPFEQETPKEEPIVVAKKEPEKPKIDPNEQPMAKPRPNYEFPSLDLLKEYDNSSKTEVIRARSENRKLIIDRTFQDFGIGAHVANITIGPSVTRFEIESDPGVSISRIEGVIEDIQQRIGGVYARFARYIMGTTYSGIEVENDEKCTVSLKEMLEAMPLKKDSDRFLVPFGLDISGKPIYADIRKFPHMIVAGTTGSGKSVFVNGIIMSLIMRNRPEDIKMVMVDPKSVEFSHYENIPHLLRPVIIDMKEARKALDLLVEEMDRRYSVFSKHKVNNIELFNNNIAPKLNLEKMPYIFLFIDEFADLIAVSRDVEVPVQRIGQKARAAGIHMLIATQRPEVKVISGTIKSNLPCHVALKLKSVVDSRTILDKGGAEKLAGYGDMLVDCQQIQSNGFVRAQGCYITDDELNDVSAFLAEQMPQEFDERFMNLAEEEDASDSLTEAPSRAELKAAGDEEKYLMIREAVFCREYISKSRIQVDYEVGFPRAGKIMNRLIKEGVVAPEPDTPSSAKGNRVLIHSIEEFNAYQKAHPIGGN